MPGRQIAEEIAALAGESQWQPISLDPNATLRSFLALLPPLAMFLAGFQVRFREKQVLVGVFVVIGLLSTLLGALQIVLDDKNLYFFWDAGVGSPSGFFGNRNHQAIFLALCALFAYYMLCEFGARFRKIIPIVLLVIALFAGAVFATQSRSGVAILIIISISAPLYLYFDVDAKKLLYGSILFFLIVAIDQYQKGLEYFEH